MFGILEKSTVKFSPKSEQKKIRHNIFNSRGLKNGNLFFNKFQNTADFFWTKNPIWPLSKGWVGCGGICMLLIRTRPIF